MGGWDARDHDAFLRVWNQVFEVGELDLALKSSTSESFLGEESSAKSRGVSRGNDDDGDAWGSEKAFIGAVSAHTAKKKSQLIRRLLTGVPIKSREQLDEHIDW